MNIILKGLLVTAGTAVGCVAATVIGGSIGAKRAAKANDVSIKDVVKIWTDINIRAAKGDEVATKVMESVVMTLRSKK